jgi:hypothetical protein
MGSILRGVASSLKKSGFDIKGGVGSSFKRGFDIKGELARVLRGVGSSLRGLLGTS